MKTLKKSLCLILALVFVLGLCTFGAGAAFTDEADIQYKDAVKIMEALRILIGFEDGSFKPGENVTRAQAAKMITYMILGETAAEKLPAAKCFDDVKATDWFAPYVNFCATKKIILGYGNGNFGPNDPVTALQLAKMLLVACGYGEMGEFASDVWEINTFTYAIETGIFDGVETEDFNAPANRDECGLYVCNTMLWVNLVAYDVDYNDYKDKGYTYGEKVWKLVNTELNNDYCYVVATAETGADYTVIEVNGSEMYFADPIDKDLIGHQVQLCYNGKSKKDADGNFYYQAYLIEDVSTVVKTSGYVTPLGELIAALGKKAGPIAEFVYDSGVQQYYVTNPFAGSGHEDGYDVSHALMKNPGFRYFKDYSEVYDYTAILESFVGYAQAHNEFNYTTFAPDPVEEGFNGAFGGLNFYNSDLLKANTTKFTKSGSFVLDEDGDVISWIESGTYTVAVVDEIEDDYIVVSNDAGFDEEIGIEYVKVEDLKVGDYVTVDFIGSEYYVYGTSTSSTTIYEVGGGMFTGYYNIFSVSPSSGKGAVEAPEGLTFAGALNNGDVVTLYLDSHGKFFGAVIDTSSKNYGYVFVAETYETSVLEDGEILDVWKALCVDPEGNSVTYKLVDGNDADSNPVGNGVYKVTALEDGYTEFTKDTTCEYVSSSTTKGYGRDTKLGAFYLADALQVFYVGAATAKHTVAVTEADVLPVTGGTTGDFWFYTTEGEDVSVIWMYCENAPSANTSYIFVPFAADSESGASGSAGGKMQAGGVDVNYYTLLKDGAVAGGTLVYKVDSVLATTLTSGLTGGLYTYTVDSYGRYELTTATGVALAEPVAYDDIHRNVLYLDLDGDTTDEAYDLSEASFYDLSSCVNSKGYLANISSLSELTAALKNGENLAVTFAFFEGLDSNEVIGTVYITDAN